MGPFDVLAKARIRWLNPSEGGRESGPPPGPQYAASAVFVLGNDWEVVPDWPVGAEYFSVGMNLGDIARDGRQTAEIDFLARDLVADLLRPGVEFLVMEGARHVGTAQVLEVSPE